MPPIRINLFLENKIHGMRRWSAVPRVGDLCVVGEGRDSGGAEIACRVTRVVWGTTLDSRDGTTDAEVEVYVTRSE